MNMNNNPIGLDIGYRAVKCVHNNGEKFLIPTIIGTPEVARMGIGTSSNMIVSFEDETGNHEFLIGESANLQSRMTMRRENRHWYSSPEFLAMYYGALSKLSLLERGAANIVTGLPVEYFDDKDDLIEVLEGEHNFLFNGLPIRVQIKEIVVVLQPFGALLDRVFGAPGGYDTEIAEGRIGVIDIGGKTTNLLTAYRLQELRKQSTSIAKGGWDIVRAVKIEIVKQYPGLSEMSDHDVSQAVVNRTVKYFGEPIDIGSIIDRIVEPFTNEILSVTSTIWNTSAAMLDRILVTGGGAYLAFPEISKHFRHAQQVQDPVFSNATGYWRYMKYLLEM